MSNPTQYIPARYRKPFYGAFAFVGVALGAVQVGYSAAGEGLPVWVNVSTAVFAFVAGAFGVTAATNTEVPSGGHVAR